MEHNPNRTIYIDLLRIAATFGVVILHVAATNFNDTPVETFNWQTINAYLNLQRWAVPIFVMISGMFHLRISKSMEFNDEKRLFFKKSFRLVCALVFWGVVYNSSGILEECLSNRQMFSWQDLMKIPEAIIFGTGWYHLWFLYMLIALYLLTPLLRRLIGNCQREHIKYLIYLFILEACILLYNSLNDVIPVFPASDIGFSIIELSGFVGYYVAGYYFANYALTKKSTTGIYVLAVVSALFTVIGTSLISLYHQKPTPALVDNILPNTIFVAFAVFILFQNHFSKITFTPKQEKIIVNISQNTFGIYLVHALVKPIIVQSGFNLFVISPLISIPLISIVVMIVSYIITVGIKRIPILGKYVV